ncbi:MAG: asparagine synthase (glutamine-hydrolyzing) [Rhodothermia bacterium]
MPPMCGIVGFWAPESPGYDPGPTIGSMTDSLKNRGPDASGDWWHDEFHVALGHRRLSILDLSSEGAQPMRSLSGRYTVTYNGEVFNYRDLQRDLEPAEWRGHSDTEVILAAFERWGVEAAVKRFNGQFAFAVWDEETKSLTLVRDRLGIKPLYYGWFGGTFVFGSELDAVRMHPRFEPKVNPRAIASLLEVGYVPAPFSIFNGVFKLLPGTLLTLQTAEERASPRRYWSISEAASRTRTTGMDPELAADTLDALLRDSVAVRLVADVPVGAFLSGGIDSSLVCGAMCSVASGPVKTYSIGFEEARFDEAPYAAKVASHLGTDHTSLYVSAEEAMGVLHDLPGLYDEPFADASQIPTFLVSRLARNEVVVSLSGDGGDELFGGYNRYERALSRWPRMSQIPSPLRKTAADASRVVSVLECSAPFRAVARQVPRALNRRVGFGQLARALSLVGSATFADYYRRSVSLAASGFAGPELLEAARHEPALDIEVPGGLDLLHTMTYVDMLSYLPDDILVKVDRASMAVSLEVRVPLLDHRIVEYSWSLGTDLKIRNGDQKWLLKHLLKRYVPPSLTERPKKGFGVPIGSWLRGPLKELAESLLDERALAADQIFDPGAVGTIWRQHLAKQAEVHVLLWRILMYQAWKETIRCPAPRTRERVAV